MDRADMITLRSAYETTVRMARNNIERAEKRIKEYNKKVEQEKELIAEMAVIEENNQAEADNITKLLEGK